MTKYRFTFLCVLLATAGLLTYFISFGRAVTWTVMNQPVTTQVVNASGGAQSNAATLTGAVGRMTYIEGFDVTGGGATGASVINITVTGTTNTLNLSAAIAAGATGPAFGTAATNSIYSVRFPTPIPSSATNTNIVVTVPSFGAGNTNATVTAYGFSQ